MDRLPPELLALIASYLERSDLVSCASVSRQWQFAVERHNFRSIHLKSNELDRFAIVFSANHRTAALAELNFHVLLPAYSDNRCAKFENEKEKKANNEAFTDALIHLFRILHSWENPSVRGVEKRRARPIALVLCAYSPTDPGFREERYRPNNLEDHRYEDSFLSFLKPEELPSVERINCFVGGGVRNVDASALAEIAAKLPALERVDWTLEDVALPGTTLRYQRRNDFARALSSVKPSSLTSFYLLFPFMEPRNEDFLIPSAVPATFAPTDDPLSSALYAISQLPNLRHFRLDGPVAVSPSLFGGTAPSCNTTNGSTTTQPALYPNLQMFQLELNRMTPSGGWLFTGDPADADLVHIGSDRWRLDTYGMVHDFRTTRT